MAPSPRKNRTSWILAINVFATGLIGFKCSSDSPSSDDKGETRTATVVRAYPHDPDAFTQGLYIKDGALYESTGQYGSSTLRKVSLETGDVLFKFDVPAAYFAEGLTYFQDRFYQLTWRGQTALAYTEGMGSFQRDNSKDFSYSGEGWGLTNDDKHLIISNGSDVLSFYDPVAKKTTKTIKVTSQGKSISQLNELEYIEGRIWANVWHKNDIVVIDPETGDVDYTIAIDTNALFANTSGVESTRKAEAVLNGIAYDPNDKRVFVTGKLWSKLFEIKVDEP